MHVLPTLATIFLFATFSQVSGETINCYACQKGVPASINFRAPLPDKLPECKDPIDGSATTTATTGDNGEVCIKVVVSGTIKVGTTEADVEAIVRHKFPISGKCGAIESLISDAGDLADLDLSADCYECDEDKCNSATSIQISFLSFLALFVSLYFIRR